MCMCTVCCHFGVKDDTGESLFSFEYYYVVKCTNSLSTGVGG